MSRMCSKSWWHLESPKKDVRGLQFRLDIGLMDLSLRLCERHSTCPLFLPSLSFSSRNDDDHWKGFVILERVERPLDHMAGWQVCILCSHGLGWFVWPVLSFLLPLFRVRTKGKREDSKSCGRNKFYNCRVDGCDSVALSMPMGTKRRIPSMRQKLEFWPKHLLGYNVV